MEILDEVLERVKPKEEERERLKEVSEKLIDRVKEESEELGINIEPKLVGSAARDTWLSEERDIDIFLLFPVDVPRERLETEGLKIGKKVARGGNEQYAEHPYVNAKINGFDVDIVPCYDVDNPMEIKSSVDRSPHHQEYIKGWLTPEGANEVLILKKFLKGIGVYGSDLRVKGFSGYLSELLIIRYGSFNSLVNSVKNWGEKKVIALGDTRGDAELREAYPNHPLIFIDPVDPTRNVAAAVSKRNFAIFVRACQDFAENPSMNFFFPKDPISSPKELRSLLKSRGSNIFMISIEIPFNLVPDIVYPQLRKSKRTIVRKLEEADFEVVRSSVWNRGNLASILVEVKHAKLPKVREHLGPPLGVNSKPFIDKYLDSKETFSGPYVRDDGRLVYEIEREKKDASEVFKDTLESSGGLGSHIEKSIKLKGYEVFQGEEIVKEAEDIGALGFLGDYLKRCLPWYR